ncbi:MAG: hypothetical protein AAF387_11955 [Pseudomonadota bacterium]
MISKSIGDNSRYLIKVFTGLLCLQFIGLSLAHGEETADVDFSEAETLIWMTNQLDEITAPVTLHYNFSKTGSFESGFEDVVEFIIDKVHDDGMKSASLKFFTGERNFKVPPVERTDVNPVLKIYLQGDVYEMNRLTDPDGSSRERWRYFQRRIKFALSDAADIEDVEIQFDGKSYAARRVTFRPYVNDPKRNLFEKFAGKEYEIVVSDDLPGYLYKIRTVIPGQEGGEPLIVEELILSRMESQSS